MQRFLSPSPEQKEKAQHGKQIFPLQQYVTVLDRTYPVVTAHWHDEAEFTYIRDGTCTYQIQLETYEACQGDFIFIPPTVLHSITVSPTVSMESETYVFHMNFPGANSADICAVRYLAPIASLKLIPPFVIRKSHPAYKDFFSLFEEISQTYEEARTGYELMLKSQLLKLFSLLLPFCIEGQKEPQIHKEHIKKLKDVLEYIETHYAEEISIAELAGLCYFSEYHFMRFFKKNVGMPCLEYIKNYRLEQAVQLLERGEMSVLDVSLAAGFHNLSYFYREFKKKYGMTPKEFLS